MIVLTVCDCELFNVILKYQLYRSSNNPARLVYMSESWVNAPEFIPGARYVPRPSTSTQAAATPPTAPTSHYGTFIYFSQFLYLTNF